MLEGGKFTLGIVEKSEEYEKLDLEMQELGYSKQEGTISVYVANMMSFVTAGPFALMLILCYIAFNGLSVLLPDNLIFFVLLIVTFIICTIVHEILHGITWAIFCKNNFKSINFGIMSAKELFTPYCHCKEILNSVHYILGCLAPFIILGIVPGIISIIINNPFLMWLSAFNILSAGGDTTISIMILKDNTKDKIMDHPNECGYIAYKKD